MLSYFNPYKIRAIADINKLPKELLSQLKENNIKIESEFSTVFSDLLESKIDILIIHIDYFRKYKIQYTKLAKRLSIVVSTIIIDDSDEPLILDVKDAGELDIADVIRVPFPPERLDISLHSAKNIIGLKKAVRNNKRELEIYKDTIKTLNEIGLALSREKELDTLLDIILRKIRRLTNSDSGSIFIIGGRETLTKEEREQANRTGHIKEKNLIFKIAQNDSSNFPFKEQKMPISKKSIAGYVAIKGVPLLIKDVYHLTDESDYLFNTDFDHLSGYKSKSMLVLPMKNHKDEIVGIIQLINRKTNRHIILNTKEDADKYVIPFDLELEDLTMSVASQAAVAIENLQLIQNINSMVEGFVKASVTAIEQRDPTSGGHSERVAQLSVATAEEINNIDSGRFKYINFSYEQITELKYAALLHDFGKVGVREHILTKAKKLHKWELELIKERFGYLKEYIRANSAEKKIEFVMKHPKEKWLDYISKADEEAERKLNLMEYHYNFIIQKNNPCYMNRQDLEKIENIAEYNFTNVNKRMRPLLKEKEIINLRISKGTLNDEERKQINDHVVHSYNFLIKIPWLKSLKNVPEIAYGHHEKLDGSGYPRGIKAPQIPLQTKIMTVCDIFDALTASDRPYRFALPIEKAIHILELNAEEELVDRDIVDLFRARKVYRSIGLF
jgi:HD-GYP domain-containing protein (c-di-GMP phosphodiesterase class II)